MKRLAVAAFFQLSSIGYGHAQAITTGNELQEICQNAAPQQGRVKTQIELFKSGQCVGFVTAIVRVGKLLVPGAQFCVPENVTPDQAVKVVLKFLRDYPADTNKPAETLAIAAFFFAWPCK